MGGEALCPFMVVCPCGVFCLGLYPAVVGGLLSKGWLLGIGGGCFSKGKSGKGIRFEM